jgi:hypothetical protein
MPIPEPSSQLRVLTTDVGAQPMKSISSICGTAAAIVVFAILIALDASPIRARNAESPQRHHHRSHRYLRLPPHHQPRRANAPDIAIEPTAKEQAVDRKINNICRGC